MCLAIPGKVLEEFDQRGMRMAKVQFGGIVREASLDYVPEAKVGDYVLVHVGFAISTVDAEEAARTYQLLEEMDQLTELQCAGGGRGVGEEAAMKYHRRISQSATGAIDRLQEIRRIQTRPWVIMEVCGGQTHSIVKHGIDRLLPEGIELVHGPGCPVCVTPLETIDKAHAIAAQSERNLLFVRRHAARAGIAWRSVHAEIAGRRHPRGLLAAGLPEDSARPIRTSMSSSSPSGLRRPRRQTRCWSHRAKAGERRRTFPSWCHTRWCRRRSPTSCNRRRTVFRDFLGQGMCARSWAIANTSRSANATRFPS